MHSKAGLRKAEGGGGLVLFSLVGWFEIFLSWGFFVWGFGFLFMVFCIFLVLMNTS